MTKQSINPNKRLPLRGCGCCGQGAFSGRQRNAKVFMRFFLILWLGPMALLGIWYALASNDLHFGMFLFSREIHDEVFGIYAAALGMEPEALPPLVLRAIIVDTLFVLAFIAFRRRKVLIPWVKAKLERLIQPALPEAGPAPTAE